MNNDTRLKGTPTISELSPDGTIIELLYNSVERTTALAVSRPDGSLSVEAFHDTASDERLVPYAATNNLITTGCVLLPSDIGDFTDKVALVAEIRDFIHRFVDLSPLFEEIATYYVLLSWVYDAFNELGYLRFRGDYGTGKTRALLTIGSLCYKSFFASGASTVSPIFHVLETFRGTLILDEADFRFSDATAELTKILNNGNVVGLPILRTMSNRHRELNPQAFRVFGPKLVAMRKGFSDPALESRFLTEETSGRTLRDDIPIQLPDSLGVEALALRNKLLSWRFHARFKVETNPSRLVAGIEPRFNQTALALLSLIDDSSLRQRIADALVGEGARVLQERASSPEATMIAAVLEAMAASPTGRASLAEVATAYGRRLGPDAGVPMSNKGIGGFLRGRLYLSTAKSNGTYVVPSTERPKIDALAKRYGLDGIEREVA